MADAQAVALDLMYGRWRSQILYAGAKLGIFDVMTVEPQGAGAIAEELGLDPALSYRLLRAVGSLGLLKEHTEHRFSITEAGSYFRADHPQSLKNAILLVEGPEHYALWKHLPAMIRDGVQDGFMREYGEAAFTYAGHTPAYAQAFDAGMSSNSKLQASWFLEALKSYDFSKFATVCDVGGGQGYLLCQLLLRYPHLSGIVLERPGVIEDPEKLWAGKLNLADRCRYLGGDMFVDTPVADAYLLKLIMHDWNDEECVQILGNMRRRVSPGGRVFIVENIVPDIETSHFAKLFDIHMLCWGTGRERTVEEYADLLERAGWEFAASWFPSKGTIGVVEGVRG